jgi:transcriptional regulator with PAS, ATPase and Fis domain
MLKRLGGQSLRKVDVRIIAATNTNLEEAIQRKRFREDLYYRLSVLRIHIPPLRRRKNDIAALCRHFLRKIARHPAPELPAAEIKQLKDYHWPGNVRELKNIIERSVILQKDGLIRPSELLERSGSPHPDIPEPGQAGNTPATLAEMERLHIRMVLGQMDNNHTRTAAALSISRSTLIRKLKEYHIN